MKNKWKGKRKSTYISTYGPGRKLCQRNIMTSHQWKSLMAFKQRVITSRTNLLNSHGCYINFKSEKDYHKKQYGTYQGPDQDW